MAGDASAVGAKVLNLRAGIVLQAAEKKAGLPTVVQEQGSGLCLLSCIDRPKRGGALYFERAAYQLPVSRMVFHDALMLQMHTCNVL